MEDKRVFRRAVMKAGFLAWSMVTPLSDFISFECMCMCVCVCRDKKENV